MVGGRVELETEHVRRSLPHGVGDIGESLVQHGWSVYAG